MKHAFRSAVLQNPAHLVVSFFVHGQGSELQKTSAGLFRALLNALLSHFSVCLASLTALFENREKRFGGYEANRWSWTCKELEECLSEVLIKNTQNQHVIIFIDALDECGEDSARALLAYFSDLSQQAEIEGANFKVCVSSRHYPLLALDAFPSVSVEEKNSEDIRWYVADRLKNIRPTTKRQQIQEEILSKAQGGFQWVFLMTKTLIDRSLVGKNLLGHIAACPLTLSEMYAALLVGGSADDQKHMISLFRWILFAERPMSAQELREALAIDQGTTCTSIVKLRSRGDWSESLEDFERYVKHISKGLVEFHGRGIWEQWEESDREAQFIHQSVADFLSEDYKIDKENGRTGAGHFQLSRSCLRYLTMKEILSESRQRRDIMSSKFPLGPYAVRYVFTHIKRVEEAGVVQTDLLTAIRWSPHSETIHRLALVWIILNPNRIGTPSGWPFYGSSELHILAALGSKSAFTASLRCYAKLLHEQDKDGNTPLHIALREGHLDIALLILSKYKTWKKSNEADIACALSQGNSMVLEKACPFDLNAHNEEGETALDLAATTKSRGIVVRLLGLGASAQHLDQPYLLLFDAIASKDIALIKQLIAARINLAGAVYFAVETSSPEEIILELLQAGGSPDRLEIGDGHESDDEAFDYDIDTEFRGGNALHLACQTLSKTKVDLLLSNGVSATILDRYGRYPLHVAISVTDESYRTYLYDHICILESLLEAKPEAVELEDSIGRTALDVAIEDHRQHFVEVLLEQGQFSKPSPTLTKLFVAEDDIRRLLFGLDENSKQFTGLLDNVDFETRDEWGQTVFWRVVANRQADTVRKLIKSSAVDVNATDRTLTSPLLAAVQKAYTDMVAILLTAHSIDVNIKNDKQISPLLAAVTLRNIALVELILGARHIYVNAKGYRGMTPLAMAAVEGDLAISKALIARRDVDVNMRDECGDPLLFAAVRAKHVDIVEVLLQRNDIDVNAENGSGITPLSMAIQDGNIAMVQLLLRAPDIDLHAKDRDGVTPLVAAVSYHCPLVLHLILSADRVRTGPNKPYRALLRAAATYQDTGLGKSLLLFAKKIINSEKTDRHAQGALSLAILAKNEAVVKLLLATGEVDMNVMDNNGYSTLTLAVLVGDLGILRLLIGLKKFDLNQVDGHGDSPLWTAILHGKIGIVKLLLDDTSVDVNVAPGSERLPSITWWAAQKTDKAVFKMLLATGRVQLDVTNKDGETLLLWAAKANSKIVAGLLLDTGQVDINHIDRQGMTAFEYAEQHGRVAILELLQAYTHKERDHSPSLVRAARLLGSMAR